MQSAYHRAMNIMAVLVIIAALGFAAVFGVGPTMQRGYLSLRGGPAVELVAWQQVETTVQRGATYVEIDYTGKRFRDVGAQIAGFWYKGRKSRVPWERKPLISGGYSVADGQPRTYRIPLPTPETPAEQWPPVGSFICYDDVTTFIDDPTPPLRTPRLCWEIVP